MIADALLAAALLIPPVTDLRVGPAVEAVTPAAETTIRLTWTHPAMVSHGCIGDSLARAGVR